MKFIKLHISVATSFSCFALIGFANLCPSFFRFNSKRLKKLVLSFIFLFAFASVTLAQYSNVKVSNTATSGGTWSALISSTYTFTPNSDNANILYTDIQTKLLSADVKIITTNTSGTQVGNVNITNNITAPNNTSTAHTFYIQASGDINVVNPITLSSSYTPANNINFTTTGNISVNAAINTAGWFKQVGTTNGAAAAGSITLNASGKFYTSSAGSITDSGGLDTYYNYYGYAGAISITGTNGVSTNASISNLPYNNNTSYAKTIIINDGNGTTTTGGGINDGQVAGIISGVDFIKNGSGTFIIKNTNTYIGTTTINEGTLKLGSTNTLPTSIPLIINAGTTLDMASFTQTVGSLTGTGTITSATASATPLITIGNLSTNTTFSGVIENGAAASLSLTKYGSGTLILSGNSTYTGATNISAGVINIQHANALGNSSKTTVASGATLQIQGDITIGALPLTIKGVGVSTTGALRNISGNNTWGGTITTETPATSINSNAGTLTLNATNAINSTTNIAVTFGGIGHITIPGTITIGSAGFTKDGSGTLTLTNANTYTGTTTINAGVVNIQNNTALGTSSLVTVANNASLQLQNNITAAQPLNLSGSNALKNISGDNTWNGNIALVAAYPVYITTTTGTLTISGIIANATTDASLTKVGDGTLLLNAANTYTGATNINAGTITLGNNEVIANASNIVFNGGTLNTNNFNETVGQLILQTNSTLALGNSSHTITFSSAGTFSFKRLTITGWLGNYASSSTTSTATAGKIFIGSTASLTREQLDQIQFNDGTNNYYAVQLTTGEIVPGANTATSPTGYSNIQITALPTANGTWSALTDGIYTFTPNSDNANILYTDIQTKLLSADVKIITTNTSGTQVGNVNITNNITAPNNTSTAHNFYIIASGDINVVNAITLSSSYTPANNINFTATGNISVNAAINTAGWVNYVGTTNGAAAAGSITLNASGKFYTSSAGSITATGGSDTYYSNYYGYAGAISITGTNGVSTNANISNLPYNNNTTYAKTIIINDGNGTATTGGGINDGQVAGIISGVDFIKNGSGTFIIKNTNTYIGTTTINEGTLKLGSTNTLPTTRALVINGGTLNTGGFNQTVASISITDNSTMIMPSSVHTLTATAIGTFTAGKTLTINGWEGTYTAPGATGTKGKIIINGTALSATILGQIKFYNSAGTTTHSALQLGTKEVVAGN